MRKCVVATLVLFAALHSHAQFYPVSAIPDSLKENADMVVRLDETVVEIKSPGKMVFRKHQIYTIMNEHAIDNASYLAEYDKFISINYVNGTLYDAKGKELEHFKKKDMKDYPVEDGMSLVNDDRFKSAGFSYRTYPFTVEFEMECEIANLLGIPQWAPPRSANVSVENSRYTIISPKDYKIRYKLINAVINPTISEKNDKLTSLWEIKNMTVIPDEPFAVPRTAYEPYMLVGASEVEFAGYKGSMSSWNDFGKFYGSLQKGRDMLPDEVKARVHALTDGLSDPQKKIAVLYDYLQKNSHYIDIRLGIGGLQTFDAAYVANNKYGDCKALSNFMVSLLKEANIKAYAVVIGAGKQTTDFVSDFCHDPFNHVLCCVPLEKDTVWLECVSQFQPAGYLTDDFTANRYGLLIGDNGGELVHTPAYSYSDNLQERHIMAELDETGTLKLKSKASFQATSQDDIEDFIDHHSKEEQLRMLKTSIDLPTYDVNGFNYEKDYSKKLPIIRASLDLTVADYAQVSGKRIFINPDIMTRSKVKLMPDSNRHFDIEFDYGYSQTDSVQITIPAGYEIEGSLRNVSLHSKFGKYETHTIVESGKIRYYRMFERYSGRYPKAEFPNVVQFYNEIYKSDHSKIVLVKKS